MTITWNRIWFVAAAVLLGVMVGTAFGAPDQGIDGAADDPNAPMEEPADEDREVTPGPDGEEPDSGGEEVEEEGEAGTGQYAGKSLMETRHPYYEMVAFYGGGGLAVGSGIVSIWRIVQEIIEVSRDARDKEETRKRNRWK